MDSMNVTPTTSSILLIDDDHELGQMLRDYLVADSLAMDVCVSGEAGLQKLRLRAYDLVILDIMLPAMNGLDVLRTLRTTSDVPVIMLTARGDDVDRIIGLEFGADDYLAKPFNPRELAARIKAILRRSHPPISTEPKLTMGSISLDQTTRTASVNSASLALTGTEFELLRCLLQTPGQVVSKQHLSEAALGRRLLPYDRSVDTHISNLRKKFENAGGIDETIMNQRGIGYLLIPTGGQPDADS
jgi:two-component system response regulator CpxR